jgi:hypothetical protein
MPAPLVQTRERSQMDVTEITRLCRALTEEELAALARAVAREQKRREHPMQCPDAVMTINGVLVEIHQ